MRAVHPIEQESYAILRARLAREYPQVGGWGPLGRAVLERVVHASADLEFAADLVVPGERVLAEAVAGLRAGVPVVADVAMVAAGITRCAAVCRITDPRAARVAAAEGITRSAAALRLAALEAGPGAVYVIGCAPTALFELIEGAGRYRPSLVVGMPVGFVGAVESKAALRAHGDLSVCAVSNRGGKGGSAVAAAAVNALLYYEEGRS
ncbi:precorrin-8X methylmutase [Actinocrinis puniceicyclus]|uniref:Precorrin-8X methylmutase n=1 Tax=Actinocrinis puniceicyclus TaxID=977794 RepID=A0A8J8BE74_9ACTN|nr:precorrin-8X methylmutase [Actinocrinis puniceicyclus]MBS2966997.1 precorrin-8X methylmutase [Actinocrinis puniceicyclus]